jgi:hypothetical protein
MVSDDAEVANAIAVSLSSGLFLPTERMSAQ